MPEMIILEVAVAVPVYSTFEYLAPAGCDGDKLVPGVRLRVPFGRGERYGVLLGVTCATRLDGDRLKQAFEVLDEEALFSDADLALLCWAADYYRHPLGEVVSYALPARLRRGAKIQYGERVGWRLSALGALQDPGSLTKAPRQAELLRLLRSSDGMTQDELNLAFGACTQVVRRLEGRGWIERVEVAPPEAIQTVQVDQAGPTLNREQQQALAQIVVRLGEFGVFLLDGVTGSGKTEVYLELLQRVGVQGGQVLVLVPEIGLTPQLLRRFQRRLHLPITLLHSGLGEREREQNWLQARRGQARVVIGTRSSVFVPLPDLRLILVDEEHDLSFKQQEGFRFSARDLAVVRAQRCGCPVVLGSATPSLESLKNALDGKYYHLRLLERAGSAQPPRIDLLDIRSSRLEAGVSPLLKKMLEDELQGGNQVLLFLNRRGYAPILTCHDCGWLAECRRCDARMTMHLSENRLSCHHCGAQYPVVQRCPECGSSKLRTLGQGTERIEEMLRKHYPYVPLVRIDRDATRRKGTLMRMLDEVKAGKYALLLGTQMLAKGHHFPNVTLVGILDLDQALFGADFRAAERMAQLIVQVAGRAGRAEKPGRVLIQTRHPDHPLLQTLLRSGYSEFAVETLRERRQAQLPPFSFQALLRAEAHQKEQALEFLEQSAVEGGELGLEQVELLGPVSAPMERRAGRYRFQLLLQSHKRSALQIFLAAWVTRIAANRLARRVRWSIDVDPQELL
ncbi:MAG: primosomal protein N' [Chromatiaceae bacterium]|nr:primosomal protein N' [Chromatiaceae bacterium]